MGQASRPEVRAAIRKAPERLRKELHVGRRIGSLARGRLAHRRAEVEQPEHALSRVDPDDLAPPRGAEQRRRPPVGREPALRRGEQDEHDRGGRRAEVLLVLDELPRQGGGRDDERRRPLELRRLARPGARLQRLERLGPEDAEPPRLREVMVRREPRDVEQLEKDLVGDLRAAERLVGAPALDELAERHPSVAETRTIAPARFRSCENGQPSSARSTAAASLSESSPSASTVASTVEPTI